MALSSSKTKPSFILNKADKGGNNYFAVKAFHEVFRVYVQVTQYTLQATGLITHAFILYMRENFGTCFHGDEV